MPSFAAIDAERLGPWITQQRWFASKGRIGHIAVVDTVPLCDEPPLALALIEARPLTDTGPGATERYQLLVGTEWLAGIAGDALDDPTSRTTLAELLLDAREVKADEACVQFTGRPNARRCPAATARPMGAEQSNSSLLIDDQVGLETVPASRAGDESGTGNAPVPAHARVHRCA